MDEEQELLDFIDEYENIKNTLDNLYDETENIGLKDEISGFIDQLYENYNGEKDYCEEKLEELAKRDYEMSQMAYNNDRL